MDFAFFSALAGEASGEWSDEEEEEFGQLLFSTSTSHSLLPLVALVLFTLGFLVLVVAADLEEEEEAEEEEGEFTSSSDNAPIFRRSPPLVPFRRLGGLDSWRPFVVAPPEDEEGAGEFLPLSVEEVEKRAARDATEGVSESSLSCSLSSMARIRSAIMGAVVSSCRLMEVLEALAGEREDRNPPP